MMENSLWLSADLSKTSFEAAITLEAVSLSNWTRLPHKKFSLCERGMKALLRWLNSLHVQPAMLSGVCVESPAGSRNVSWR